MKCYSLILGARNTPAGGKRFSARDDRVIRAVTFRFYPAGFTILKSSGGWFDPDARKFKEEESRQILVCGEDRARLRPWCQALAEALQQRELLAVELGPAFTFRFSREAEPA